ncbi:MAG: tetratricopeptide repeat protein [Myxococcota bacterium]
MASCPDEETIAAFVARELPPAERESVQDHCQACSACQETVSHLVRAFSPGPSPTATGPQSPGTELPRGAEIGRYLVLEPLGQGAVGVVYAAYDPELDRRLALKLLQPRRAASDPEGWRARLVREARALASISHPNVVAIHDVGTHRDEVFIAMELVPGGTLTQWLRQTPRSPAAIVQAFAAAGRGLAAAHEHGLVHRDFKPANVMMGDDGRVRVMDFGLARMTETELPTPATGLVGSVTDGTATGTLVGTPAYMAPEQLRGKAADARSDQFAFCVALHEALFGVRPFLGHDIDSLRDAIEQGQVERGSNARTSARVRRVLRRGLSAEPEARFPDMPTLLRELEPRRTGAWLGPMLLLLGLAAGGALAHRWEEPAAVATPCDEMPENLDDLWSDARQQQVAQRLNDSGRAHAARTVTLVHEAIDGHATRWSELRAQACGASLPSATTDDALACLRRNRRDVEALLETLANADGAVADEAARMTLSLPRPESCTAEGMQGHWAALLPDGEARAEAEAILDDLVQPRALSRAGQAADAAEAVTAAVERARALGHRPAIVEALLLLAQVHHEQGQSQTALREYEDAALLATEAGYRHGAVRAWTRVAKLRELVARQQQRAAMTVRLAQAELDAFGGDDELAAKLDMVRGDVAFKSGERTEALAAYQRARQRYEQLDDVLGQADALAKLARLHRRDGQTDEVFALIDALEAMYVAELGPEHPMVGLAMSLRGEALNGSQRFEEARQVLTRALEIQGPDTQQAAATHDHLGTVLVELGEYEAAAEHHGRAIEVIGKARGEDNPRVVFSLAFRAHAWMGMDRFDLAKQDIERGLALTSQNDELLAEREQILQMRAEVARLEGRFEDAIADLEESVRLLTAWVGAEHIYTLASRVMLAKSYLANEDPAGARRSLEAAVPRIREDIPRPWAGQARFVLAIALAGLERDRPQARALAERALADFQASDEQDLVAEVTEWLAEHPI